MSNKDSKFCINCGKSIPASAEFCPFCGAKQENITTEKVANPINESTPNMLNSFKLAFQNAFSINNIMSRANFWWNYLTIFIINILLSSIMMLTNLKYPAIIFANENSYISSYSRLLGQFIFCLPLTILMIMGFTAMIRRLHDTNRSAHYLWLLLIPIVGVIVIIVFLAQKSNVEGQRFVKSSKTKPWYKKWISWLIIVIVSLVSLISFNSYANDYVNTHYFTNIASDSNSDDDTDESDYDSSSASTEDTNETSSTTNDDDDSIMVGDDKIDIDDQEEYTSDFTDSTWANSTFGVEDITVYKTKEEYTDGSGSDQTTFNGIIRVHMSVTAGQDINAFMTQSTLNTSDGQQIDADLSDSDNFDGELNSGTDADGYVYFLVPKMDSADGLTSIRLKWDAYYDTDDYDDDNSDKTFDTTINLTE